MSCLQLLAIHQAGYKIIAFEELRTKIGLTNNMYMKRFSYQLISKLENYVWYCVRMKYK